MGSRSTNAGPRGCYATSDGRWIALSASTPRMAERMLQSYELGHLLNDARFATNEARVRHAADLDVEVSAAIGSRTLAENVAIIDASQLTAQPVQTIEDIERDAHWQARGLTRDVADEGRTIRMHDVVPRLSGTPGEIRSRGGELGADSDAIFTAELGLTPADLARLRAAGVI
jgi:crotonobetainyl-CoA:carnitine CoA-transferase CaiB-like acyl-CoA transferase